MLKQEQLLKFCKDLEALTGRPAAVQEFWHRLTRLKLECFQTIDDILYASPLHQLSPDATQQDPITQETIPSDQMLFFKPDVLQDGNVAYVYSFATVRNLLQRTPRGQIMSPITRKSIQIYEIQRVDAEHA